MNLPPLFFLRHGQTEWNLEGRLQGHKDSPLTDLGRSQALAQRDILAPVFENFPEIEILSSPLGRAFDTAVAAADGRVVQQVDALKEVWAGSWEGRLRADIVAELGGSAQEEDMFALFLNAPDGEGADGLHQRSIAFLQSLSAPSVIVSHGVVSAYLRGLATGLNSAQIEALPHEQGVVIAVLNGAARTLRSSEDMQSFLKENAEQYAALCDGLFGAKF